MENPRIHIEADSFYIFKNLGHVVLAHSVYISKAKFESEKSRLKFFCLDDTMTNKFSICIKMH